MKRAVCSLVLTAAFAVVHLAFADVQEGLSVNGL